jgi:hypothetical protein
MRKRESERASEKEGRRRHCYLQSSSSSGASATRESRGSHQGEGEIDARAFGRGLVARVEQAAAPAGQL